VKGLLRRLLESQKGKDTPTLAPLVLLWRVVGKVVGRCSGAGGYEGLTRRGWRRGEDGVVTPIAGGAVLERRTGEAWGDGDVAGRRGDGVSAASDFELGDSRRRRIISGIVGEESPGSHGWSKQGD